MHHHNSIVLFSNIADTNQFLQLKTSFSYFCKKFVHKSRNVMQRKQTRPNFRFNKKIRALQSSYGNFVSREKKVVLFKQTRMNLDFKITRWYMSTSVETKPIVRSTLVHFHSIDLWRENSSFWNQLNKCKSGIFQKKREHNSYNA